MIALEHFHRLIFTTKANVISASVCTTTQKPKCFHASSRWGVDSGELDPQTWLNDGEFSIFRLHRADL